MIRSMLFIPADSEKKLAKAAAVPADALILDLEDAVLPERKPLARRIVAEFMATHAGSGRFWIRVNDVASGELLKDLPVAVAARPAGIMLPKIRGPEDVALLSHYLDALEAANGLDIGVTRIIPLVTETPIALLRLGELARQSWPRVQALTWGAEDLSAALGAGDPRTPDGAWRATYAHARGQCLLAAHALAVEALDTIHVDFRDADGLRRSCIASRDDGFTGRMAIHPDQVGIINEAFTPSPAALDHARRVVAAFAAGAGAVAIDGKMYDIPHLKAAQRLLGA